MRKKKANSCFLVLLICSAARICSALEPTDNVPSPQGSYFTIYPLFSRATRLMDKNGDATPVDPDVTLYQNTFKYSYSDKTLLPNTTAFCVLLPVGYVNILGDHDGGIGDPSFFGGYWFVDDPVAKTWLGARLQTFVPIGSYDKESKANMGTNVWKFRPMLFFAKQMGNVQLELTTKYTIYTTNNDTDTRLGNEVIVEGYAGYFPRPDLLLGWHVNSIFGEDKTVASGRVPDSGVRIYQTGPSVLKKFGNGFSVTVEALSDVAVHNSTEGYTVQARLIWKL